MDAGMQDRIAQNDESAAEVEGEAEAPTAADAGQPFPRLVLPTTVFIVGPGDALTETEAEAKAEDAGEAAASIHASVVSLSRNSNPPSSSLFLPPALLHCGRG